MRPYHVRGMQGRADRHGFPPALPSMDVARRVATLFIGLPALYSLVAIQRDAPVGVIFLDEGDPIRGIAIVAGDPAAPRGGIGRALVQAPPERAPGAPRGGLGHEAHKPGSEWPLL